VEHVGIDLGGRLSQICARSASGDIVDERKIPTTSIQAYLLERPASRVVLETCSEAFAVANQVLELGHEVRVVPSTLAPTLGVGARKTKSDVRDARVLSEVSCRIDLPSVHIPSEKSRSRKTMCGMREQLVACRTATANCVRGWLRTRCLRLPSGGVSTFAARVREMAQAKKLQLPTFVERMLETLDHLCTQIAAADREPEMLCDPSDRVGIARRLAAIQGKRCRRGRQPAQRRAAAGELLHGIGQRDPAAEDQADQDRARVVERDDKRRACIQQRGAQAAARLAG